MNKQFTINIPISKIDEEQRIVYGVASSEAIDSQGDIVDYEASKVAFNEWLGNIREMHQPVSVGKAIDIQFDDVTKEVTIGAKISESADGENAWIKVKEEVLKGFSIGGSIKQVQKEVAKDKDGVDTPVTRVVKYDLSEVSLVDNPANPDAMFSMVKSQDGHLQRVEHNATAAEIKKEFRLPSWHNQFMPTMEKAQALYDKSMSKPLAKAGTTVVDGDPRDANGSTVAEVVAGTAPKKAGTTVPKRVYGKDGVSVTNKAKEADMKKGMWDASWLLDLAIDLSYYIQSEQYEGEDTADLQAALDTLKNAVIKELTEATAELTVAVELAEKVTNLAKEKAMSQENPVLKSTAVGGGEERDENAAVVTTPEENGRPLNDTEERAAEAGEKPAVEGEAPIHDEASAAGEAARVKAEQDAAEAEAAEKVEESEKSVTLGDLRKFTDGLITKLDEGNKAELKKVLGEISDKVEKSMASLEGRIKSLEDQPAAITAKASFVDIEKGAGSDSENDAELQTLLKRQEALMKDPHEGTPQERMEVGLKLRKFQAAGAKLN